MIGTEPRKRHTSACIESARPCLCTELDRLHEDWRALRAIMKWGQQHLGAVRAALHPLARSKAALEDLHLRIITESGEDQCPFCRLEEGP